MPPDPQIRAKRAQERLRKIARARNAIVSAAALSLAGGTAAIAVANYNPSAASGGPAVIPVVQQSTATSPPTSTPTTVHQSSASSGITRSTSTPIPTPTEVIAPTPTEEIVVQQPSHTRSQSSR